MIPNSTGGWTAPRSYGRSMAHSISTGTSVENMKALTVRVYVPVIGKDIATLTPEEIHQILVKSRILWLFETINDGLNRLGLSHRRFVQKARVEDVAVVSDLLEIARIERNSTAHPLEFIESTDDLDLLLVNLTVLAEEFVRILSVWLPTVKGNLPVAQYAHLFLRFWRTNYRLNFR